MFNPDDLKPIKIIKQNDRQKIMLAVNPDGEKYLLKEIEGDKREIYKTLQKISHRSIPKIYHISFKDKTIVVEEYIDGISLSDIMEKGDKISKKNILSVYSQILDAVDVLHDNRIIHRDIKPDNIMVDESFNAWLIDYDISRIFREELRKDTETMGTFGYAPIEQFGMMPTDYKTDIYALGMTLKALLDYSHVKGYLYKIAEKSKKLDPAERYQSIKALKRAVKVGRLNGFIFFALAFIVLTLVAILGIGLNSKTENKAKEIVAFEEAEEDFEGNMFGFDETENENTWVNYNLFSTVFSFRIENSSQHALFLEDSAKTGKLKLGENDSIIDAKIELDDGTLSVQLDDRKGHTFKEDLSYSGQYDYEENYTDSLRVNADITCYDLDADGGAELLLALNEGSFKIMDKTIYNNFNYCIAWCIKYDENTGFTLCEGEMFSEGASFWINSDVRKVNVYWENFGDINGYILEGDKIKALR